ncbi:MAG: hypothetical protein KAH25_04060 [Bacteroidales bacterium]|nr:hypothetical protein [Bacteroidales bacterium]
MTKHIRHIYIGNSHLFINGNLVLKGENPIFVKFLKEIYKFLQIKYPKYYKMDTLSKLGFLAAEVLLHDQTITSSEDKIGIVVGNRASTFLVDSKHQETINDKGKYFPSPANFVYTLPNVMTGEICIRNHFKGENAVFMMEQFDTKFITNMVNMLFKADKADALIGGFVDADEDDYEAFLFLAERQSDGLFDHHEIEKIYKEINIQANK